MLNHIKWHDLAVLLYYPILCNETLYNGTRTNLLFGDIHTVAVLLPWHFFFSEYVWLSLSEVLFVDLMLSFLLGRITFVMGHHGNF